MLFFLKFATLILFFLCHHLECANITWTGAANDHNWDTPANWDTNAVPGFTDTAFFQTGPTNFPSLGTPTVLNIVFNDGPITIGSFSPNVATAISSVNSLTGDNTFLGITATTNIIASTGSSLTFSNPNASEDTLLFLANSIVGDGGKVVFAGRNSWNGGSDLTVTNGVTLELSSTGALGEGTGLTPPTIINLSSSTLMMGLDFTIQTIPVSLQGTGGTINTNGFNATMDSLISGTKPLNKDGEGTLFLKNTFPNTYSGGTNIVEGTINIIRADNLGSGTLSIDSGGTIQAGANAIDLTIPVHLSGISNIDTNTFSLTLTSVISGSGLLNKIHEGTLILNSANNYSGGTRVNQGSLEIFSDSNLGTGPLSFLGSTTLFAGGPFTLSASRSIDLESGIVTIDSNSNNIGIAGQMTGSGLLQKTGIGSLTLSGLSSYSGGTTVQVGTLIISSDSNLGATSGVLTLAGGTTLEAAGDFFLLPNRTVSLSGGTSTIDSVGFDPTIAGQIIGPGMFSKTGTGMLSLQGANTYSGGTVVSQGTLQGTTTSLQGHIDIASGATVIFNQSNRGSYGGTLTGSGFLQILGGGEVAISGESPSFVGPTTVSGNSTLLVSGFLGASSTTIDSGSILTGTGTAGPVSNAGTVIPGLNGAGTLTVTGDISFNSGTLLTQLTPTSTGLLNVTGTANLASGTSQIQLEPGFYGFNGVRTILTAGLVSGSFANLILDPRISGHLVYHPNDVQLIFEVLNPFLDFPFANANERAVGNNIDALITDGQASADLISVIDSMKGLSVREINDALNQLHPAHLSAYAELQVELGGQLLSLFHRKPSFCGCCYDSWRIWVEPFGNWLHEKHLGMQIGFHATTRGIALGSDYQFLDFWTVGLGGAYSLTDLKWSRYGSYGYVESGYVALYNDFSTGNFFLGVSGYAGKDQFENLRKIRFSIIDRQAKSHFHGIEMGAELTSAYYFGTRSFQLYPYATADFLYLKNSSMTEHGANSLDLAVTSYCSSNLRVQAGGAISFVDKNVDETICFAPIFGMGYVLELPIHRDHFHSRFVGTSIPFTTTGWHMAWQLLNLNMGLEITYRLFTLHSSYSADISPDGDSPFFNQRANFNMSFSF